jgi:hypothetical protein
MNDVLTCVPVFLTDGLNVSILLRESHTKRMLEWHEGEIVIV